MTEKGFEKEEKKNVRVNIFSDAARESLQLHQMTYLFELKRTDGYENQSFNYSNDVYISNLSKKIKLSELEEYLKKYKNVKKVINIIKDMNIKDKLRLGICLTISDWANILYNRNEIYKKFDIMLKEVDEEYRTTLINFAKYKLVMFAMAKLMEMETTEQNKVELYLFNLI